MTTWRRRGALLVLLVSTGWLVSALPKIHALDRTAAAGASPPATRSRLFPAFTGGIPVLLYHRLTATGDSYSVDPAVFEAQLQRLHALGFRAITLDRYMRFMRGEKVALPQRPILITFDDAYASAPANADPVLARYRWTAVMYVPTGFVGRPGYLSWAQLRQLRASGRWEIEEHAGDGHVVVPVDAAGRTGPFYANEIFEHGRKETFAHYKQRVRADIERGAALLAAFLSGWHSLGSFAVPYNNYGDHGSNDRRIEPWLSRYLERRFAVSFVQRDDAFATPRLGFANRITVSSKVNAGLLEIRLRRGLTRLTARR